MITQENESLQRLEELLQRLESGGVRRLTSKDTAAFGSLYRRAVAALSSARSRGVDDARIDYLNNLVSRAYGHIYVAESKGWPSAKTFFSQDFPRSFRQNLRFILVALVISLIAGLFSYGVVKRDTGLADVVMGPGFSNTIEEVAQRHEGNKNWMPAEKRPMMSSFIITNNIKVAITAFALGITAGLGTFLVLFYNGLMLGVVSAGVHNRGPHIEIGFWGFVAPHGIIELPAIIIAGGAGLMLGWALLVPGSYTRLTALKLAGREAAKLILGVASMLLVAGIIEGFVSPSMIPVRAKFIFAAMTGFVLFAYLFTAGKQTNPADFRG